VVWRPGRFIPHLLFADPSTNGFKSAIHVWKAEHFDPDKLLKFDQENGAKYECCGRQTNVSWRPSLQGNQTSAFLK
jgi:hypothetical protein